MRKQLWYLPVLAAHRQRLAGAPCIGFCAAGSAPQSAEPDSPVVCARCMPGNPGDCAPRPSGYLTAMAPRHDLPDAAARRAA
jgi:hypothetical protein